MVVAALGGGVWGQQGSWFGHWQHIAFEGLCHQDPVRSFWINGTPMAVCSRCFGIYSGFAAAWLTLPVAGSGVNRLGAHAGKVVLAAVLANAADVAANLLGLWENTLLTRSYLGIAVGLSAVLFTGRELMQSNNFKKITYGTKRTA